LGFESDNEISYYAGPILISLDTINKVITIENKSEFEFKISDLISELKNAWSFNEANIIKSDDNIIIIKYDLDILNNYLSYSIIYYI